MAAARRDLAAWAEVLGVSNDDDAVAKLTRYSRQARSVHELVGKTCEALRGLDERVLAALAYDRIDRTLLALIEAKRGFLAHERGGK